MPSLHPEAEALIRNLDEKNVPPVYALSPESAREVSTKLFTDVGTDGPPPSVGAVQDVRIEGPNGDIPIRVYEPDGDGPYPVLVHFHGGGWVRGGLDRYDEFCRSLTDEADCLIVAAAYRRAPEHEFPAAVEDAYAATEWAAEHAGTFDGDSDRLAVGGHSAGGNLAAAVALMARDFDGPRIDHQLLIYPVTNHAFDTDSYVENADAPVLPRRAMKWFWNHYLARDIDGKHPYASPLQARNVGGLPSATVVTAGFDPLRDEGRAYADRLRDASVAVSHTDYEDMMHVFVLFPTLERAREARTQIASELREALEVK